jgi:hypothetical protein
VSRFTGPQFRGARAADRKARRAEADTRNERTLPHKRAAYWRSLIPADIAAELTASGPCVWPWKTAYANQAAISAARNGMDPHRKRQGLHPYPCPAGHFHLGRLLRRPSFAWRSKP